MVTTRHHLFEGTSWCIGHLSMVVESPTIQPATGINATSLGGKPTILLWTDHVGQVTAVAILIHPVAHTLGGEGP